MYALITRYATVRMMIGLSVLGGWRRKLLDVMNAFVNAYIAEKIYVEQPEGFVVHGKENFVYILRKALYGRFQALHEGNCNPHNFLIAFNCEQSLADPTMYPWRGNGEFVFLIVYFDDT